jgi:hypothetical protein
MPRRHAPALALAVVLCASGLALAGNPPVPEPVGRAAAKLFSGQTPQVEHERRGGRDVWEAGGKTTLEVELDPQGKIQELEVKVPLAAVPKPVLAAARQALPRGAKLEEAEILARDGGLFWELEGRSGRDEVELVIGPDGGLVSEETETEDDDGPDEEEDG